MSWIRCLLDDGIWQKWLGSFVLGLGTGLTGEYVEQLDVLFSLLLKIVSIISLVFGMIYTLIKIRTHLKHGKDA